MIAIAIWDENTHFCHGIRILIDRASQQMKIPYVILPAEHADLANLLFISQSRFHHYQNPHYLPCLPQRQHPVIISSRREEGSMKPPHCAHHLPRLYREDEVDAAGHMIADWLLCIHMGLPLTAQRLTSLEKRFLSLLINNYSLIRTASILQIDHARASALYQIIIQKLDNHSRERLRRHMTSH